MNIHSNQSATLKDVGTRNPEKLLRGVGTQNAEKGARGETGTLNTEKGVGTLNTEKGVGGMLEPKTQRRVEGWTLEPRSQGGGGCRNPEHREGVGEWM